MGRLLPNFYYIPPRYPNGFPSGKPADFSSEKQAQEALDAASRIIRFCEGYRNYLPWLMENPLPLVIASVAHVPSAAWGKQSPGKQGDCFAAYGGSQ